MRLHGTVVLVTGGSSGIGAAVARMLAAEGATIVLASRNEGKLRQVAETLPDRSRTLIIPTDVGDEEQVRGMIEKTIKGFGKIDVLVNNAGFGVFGSIVDLTSEEFDRVLRVNLRGTFLCMKYALPGMYERNRGTVINISSLAGKHGFAGGAAYCSSKFGVMGLAECAFNEARSHNVRMVTICPGSVDTMFFDEANTTSPNRDKILQPEDVAATVLLALTLPERALVRELDIRPTNPR
ncbi:MAG: SDR family NAD(P)-dependent oxidoreductase [Candidatus Kapaibacterium sp.]